MARMSRFSKTGGAVMKGTLEAVAAGNCAFFGAHTIWRSTGIASLAPLVVASLLILLYGERGTPLRNWFGKACASSPRDTTPVADRPLRYCLNRRTRSWETNPSCFGISKIEWPDHRRHGRAPQGTRPHA